MSPEPVLLRTPSESHMAQSNTSVQMAENQIADEFQLGLRRIVVGQEYIYVAPAFDVTLLEVEIPTSSLGQAITAAPFAVEDHLAVDPNAVHVAVGPRSTSGLWLAAIVDASLMADWIESFASNQNWPKAVIPEVCAIPTEPGEVICIDRDDHVVVAFGDGLGCAVDIPLLGDVLADIVQERAINSATLYTDRPHVLSLPEDLSSIPTEIRQPLTAADYDALLAQGVAGTHINLLQGHFAQPLSWSDRMSDWGFAVGATALAFCFFLLLTGLEGRHLNQQADDYYRQTEVTFRQAMPDVRRMVNPKTQLEARVRELRGTANNDFLALSAALFESLTLVQGTQLDALSFVSEKGEVSATVRLNRFSDMESLRTSVANRGFLLADEGSRAFDRGVISDVVVSRP